MTSFGDIAGAKIWAVVSRNAETGALDVRFFQSEWRATEFREAWKREMASDTYDGSMYELVVLFDRVR